MAGSYLILWLDESERWKDANSMKSPVDQRGIAKSLPGNGGAARYVTFLSQDIIVAIADRKNRSLLLAGRILA